MAPTSTRYRQLDSNRILETLERLTARIEERFAESGLSNVAKELRALGDEVIALVEDIRKPHWAIRALAGVAILGMAIVVSIIARSVQVSAGISGLAELIQATDAALSTLVFLGATVFFLLTLESRLKRRRALATLHQLRSVAHIVDMHQLTKDPERIASPQPDTASSPQRALKPSELGRYLDYCSELLSVISKLAALHVQDFDDPVTLAAVNDIQTLTTGLSSKIWQKITLLDRTRTIAGPL